MMRMQGIDQSLLYFAYGSNMSTPRIASRLGFVRKIAVASLVEHRLQFHKRSDDGSAKCDILLTDNAEDRVIGVVFNIALAEKRVLDRYEGLGFGYEEKMVRLRTTDGTTLEATTYYATRIDPGLKPYAWYREHVARGAFHRVDRLG